MRVLVTGGGGFLGKAISGRLIKNGEKVRVLGRRDYPDLRLKGAEIVIADIANGDAVMQAVDSIDTVYHVASLTSIWGKKESFYNTNVVGTENVINACKKHGVKKLIYTSSPSVVYNATNQVNIDEKTEYPKKFLAFYPETKAIAEQKVLEANGKEGLLTVALRPHLIWGPGDTNLIPRLISRAKRGKVRIVGNGKNMIDVTFIDNCVDAHLLACKKLEEASPVAGSAYFITQDEPVNCWEWINSLLEGFKIPAVTQRVSYKSAYRAGAILELIYKLLDISSEPRMTRFLAAQLASSHTYNIDKAKNELDYRPAISTRDGMKELFRSYGG